MTAGPSTRRLHLLPPPALLEPLTRALATLDALLCDEWEYRYYSFNRRWAPGERMASMRDGCGDEWFLVFTPAGAFLKGLAHESTMAGALRPALIEGLPAGLAAQAEEPAFRMDETSYVAWCEPGGRWQRGTLALPEGDDPDGSASHLAILGGDPADYVRYAAEYYEHDVPLDAVAAIYAGMPLDLPLLDRLRAPRTLEEVAEDLDEIGYAEPGVWPPRRHA